MPFQCSICGEESTRICARCTKDACDNHLCEKCLRCSDCCECEVMLSPHQPDTVRAALNQSASSSTPPFPGPTEPTPDPLPPEPEPLPPPQPIQEAPVEEEVRAEGTDSVPGTGNTIL